MLRLSSSGFLAAKFQCSVLHVLDAATDLQIQPAAEINDVPYFDAAAVVRMQSHVRNGRAGFADLQARADALKARQTKQ